MNALGTIAIVIMGVVGYLITAQAMSEYSTFRYPRIMAALVVILGCIGLRQSGEGLAAALLIPFAALIVAGGVVWATARLSVRCSKRTKHSQTSKTKKIVDDMSPNVSHNPWRTAK